MQYPVYINPDARLADDVTVGPFTTIASNVEIGPEPR